MNKMLLIFLLVVGFLPYSSYSATKQSAQDSLPNAIHIDSVSINAGVDTNGSKLSEEDRKRLIYEIGEIGKDEVIKWVSRETALLGIVLAIGIFAFIYTAIGVSVNNQVSKQLEKLDAARSEAIKATAVTTVEITRSREALTEAKKLHITLHEGLANRTSEIDKLKETIKALKKSAESAYDDLRVDVKDDINFLATGDIVQTKWLQAIDATNAGSNRVIDSLIIDLKSTDSQPNPFPLFLCKRFFVRLFIHTALY